MKDPFGRFVEAFGMPEYPVLFRYADDLPAGTHLPPEGAHVCVFALLAKTRREGSPAAFSRSHAGCQGGGFYLGFLDKPREGIEQFLSCGVPGRMEGERYLKTPEIAGSRIAQGAGSPAPKNFAVFTRADRAQHGGDPQVVIFFASPDILGGLHVLANFDRKDEGVIAPFSSGCGAIVTYPLKEGSGEGARAVLGLFDLSARPYVEPDVLTFAVPYRRFLEMADNIPESFLSGKTWGSLRKRAGRQAR
jgi:hypothetical protein